MHTCRMEATPTRLEQRPGSSLYQVQPMSRAAEQGWIFHNLLTHAGHIPGGVEGRCPRMTLDQRPTCSLCLGPNTTYSPSFRAPATHGGPGRSVIGCVYEIFKAANTSKRPVTERKGCCAGECDIPTRREPGEARISTDLITLAGSRAPSSCGSDKKFRQVSAALGCRSRWLRACLRGLLVLD